MSDENDRVTFSEGVTVDIGDYEKRNCMISYTTNVAKGETPKKAYKRAEKFVLDRLKRKERQMRLTSEENVSFETMEKLDYHK